MVKVISFSLWGNDSKYTIGAIKNAELAKKFYPDFECWFYIHKDTVPQNIIDELQKKQNVKIIFKEGNITHRGRLWRYEPMCDPSIEIMLSRDTDTRILEREVIAVNEWIDSGKTFHIMRDHPGHSFKVQAGMFGTKKIANFDWKYMLDNYVIRNPIFYDQEIMEDYIYPLIINDCVIHASFHTVEPHAKPFPIPYDDENRFVGECIYEDDSRCIYHIILLKNALV